ncbi:MAG TPA: methylated-DNA--[protein]-cysteine S-methyltransferase [Caulobacteraceae bacterium]|nr:methylated-DNA--[protein]-cysteine S-methyltransferase [Caulobacteraceae bacterium]
MATTTAHALFPSDIGECAVAWGPAGITGVLLPAGDTARLRERLARRAPTAREAEPPAAVAEAIGAMQALLAGEPRDLTFIALDLEGAPDFDRRVWDITRQIPPGSTLTYGDIARRLGDVALSREVGRALGQNPCPIVVPCHRVLAANGRTGGFSAPGGVDTKLRMLSIERAASDPSPSLFGDLPMAARPQR